MRFSFSKKGQEPADTRYAYVKAGLPDTQWDLFTTLLSGSLTAAQDRHLAEDLSLLRQAVRGGDRAFIGRLAVYFAERRNFRELAFLLTAELAAVAGNEPETGLLVEKVVRTPLDIPLWLEYYARAAKLGRKPGRAVRRQLTLLFNRLDEYQYSRSSRLAQLALRDALRWLHPKAADHGKKILFARIGRDQIPMRTTWEQEWYALYQQHYDSLDERQVVLRDKWKEGISSFRIGYAPLLDNLRPMLCAGVSGKVLKLAAEYIGSAAAVKRSGIPTLRLLEVYRSLRRMEQGGAGMLAEALEKAVAHSTWGQLEPEGVSVIAMDVSNSMKRPLGGMRGAYPGGAGDAKRFDVAPLLAAVLKSRGFHVSTGIIGNTWRPLELPARPVLMSVDEFRSHEGEAGYAVNAWLILQDLLRKRQVVDRVMIFTDNRLWDNRSFNQTADTDLGAWWRHYREQLAPRAKLYLFDLAGYSSRILESPEEGVFLVTGWNEKVLEVLEVLDCDNFYLT
jgi:60 kDa SS-A/Ro ribonucleoprotein